MRRLFIGIGTVWLGCLALCASALAHPEASGARPRVIIMADFPPLDVIPGGAGYGPAEKRSDPDDLQSMIRLLLYANDLKLEGLIATSATFANVAAPPRLAGRV